MAKPSQNGSNSRVVEETVLRLFQKRGYSISRPAGDLGGTLAVLQNKEHRALVRFQWGNQEPILIDVVRAFHTQMEGLKASRGYLFTNALFDPAARKLARDLFIDLTDGAELKESLYATMPTVRRSGVHREEPPLPFAKYIPWFVGISLVLLTIIVMLLISVGVSFGPAPT